MEKTVCERLRESVRSEVAWKCALVAKNAETAHTYEIARMEESAVKAAGVTVGKAA